VSNEPEDVSSLSVIGTLALGQILVNEGENQRRYDPKRIPQFAENIKKNGLLQGLIVSELGPEEVSANGFTHKLRAGYRRYAALSSMGKKDRGLAPNADSVPVMIIPMSMDPKSVNMSENGQREEMSYIDKAKAAKARMDDGVKAGEVAADLGISSALLYQILPMIDPEKVRPHIQKAIHEGKFTLRTARALTLMSEDEQDQLMTDLEKAGKGGATAATKAAVGKRKKKGKMGRPKKGDDSGGGISAKKAILQIEETEGELMAAARAEDVTDEKKAAYKDAIYVLRAFGKFLSGAIGAQALGKRLTTKMTEE